MPIGRLAAKHSVSPSPGSSREPQRNAAYNHSVTIGSATYSCLEDSLNSAGAAVNIAGQINASNGHQIQLHSPRRQGC
jgi:hypothetical protein